MSTKAPRKPVIRTPYVKLPSRRLLFVYWGVKALAIAVGFFGTLLCLMAAIGSVTESLPLRIVGALLTTAALPLGIGLVLRRRSEEQRPLDLFTDVFAVVWLGFVFVFAFALGGLTSDLLVGESTRLSSDGVEPAAGAVALLAGGLPDAGTDASDADTDGGDAGDAGDASVFSGPAPGPSILILAPPRGAPDTQGEAARASFGELMQLAGSAVVTLTGRGKNGSIGGTGFLVDGTGTVVTAHDVVADASELSVRFEKDGTTFHEVVLLLDDPAKGVALLWVDLERSDAGAQAGFPKPLRLRLGRGTTPGERALTLANPLGMDLTLTEGSVLGRVSRDGRDVLQLSYFVPNGAEGAPVVDGLGDVIGVVIGASEEARGAAVACPVDVLSALLKPGYPDRRWIGGAK